jgi:hypothetical protein
MTEAHPCNPSYSGGRDQKKPRQIVRDPVLKSPSQIGLMGWLKVKALSSSPGITKEERETHEGLK